MAGSALFLESTNNQRRYPGLTLDASLNKATFGVGHILKAEGALDVSVATGFAFPVAGLPMGGVKITGVADGAASGDVVNKGQLDAAVAGLSWQPPAAAKDYIGTRTIVQIDALVPSAGWTVVAGSAGTPANAGSDLLAIGDVAEANASLAWKKIVSNSGGFVPDTTRLLIGDMTLYAPLTDIADVNKIAQFGGTSNTPASKTTPSNGWAILVHDPSHVSYYDNNAFAYEAASTQWVIFAGPMSVIAGEGLLETGNTLSFNKAFDFTGANALTGDYEFDALTDFDNIVNMSGATRLALPVANGSPSTGDAWFASDTLQLRTSGGTATTWHSLNDGSGSTLDADLLDGNHAAAFALSGHNQATTLGGTAIDTSAATGAARVTAGTWSVGTLAATMGGTGQSTTAVGDIMVGAAANTWAKLPIGANGYYLTSDGTTAGWTAAPAVTNSFTTMACPAGTNPVADSGSDTLNLTSTGSTMVITGNATTDTINFDLAAAQTLPTPTLDNTLRGTGSAWAANANVLSTAAGALSAVSFDRSAAGALAVAGVTATSLNLGKSAAMTTILGTANCDEAVTMDTTLGVTGASTFTGAAYANGGLDRSTAAGLIIAGTNASAVDISKSGVQTQVKGTLKVNEATTLDTTLGITGITTATGVINANGGVDRSTAAALAIAPTNATAVNIAASNGTVSLLGTGAKNIVMNNSATAAFSLYRAAGDKYLDVNTDTPAMKFGNAVDNPSYSFQGTGTTTHTGPIDANDNVTVADGKSLRLGTGGTDDTLSASGTNTLWTHNTGDLTINNTLATGSTIFKLGTTTVATDFQIQDSSGAAKLTIFGSGKTAIIIPDATAAAFNISDSGGGDSWFDINTSTSKVTIGSAAANPETLLPGTGSVFLGSTVPGTATSKILYLGLTRLTQYGPQMYVVNNSGVVIAEGDTCKITGNFQVQGTPGLTTAVDTVAAIAQTAFASDPSSFGWVSFPGSVCLVNSNSILGIVANELVYADNAGGVVKASEADPLLVVQAVGRALQDEATAQVYISFSAVDIVG